MIPQENICFFEELETEELILYPSVKRKINKHGLKYYNAYTPERVPQERI